MQILIVGGGKAGRFLIKEFLQKGYTVTLVEQDINKCLMIEEKYGIHIVNGDGSEPKILEKAGIEDANVVLAVTEDDQDNLVICQLAERQFNVSRTFATVNTPGNENLFEWLGVNVAVSSTSILAALVDQKVTMKDITGMFKLPKHDLMIVEVTINSNSPVISKMVKDINLPSETILVTILRGNTALVPRGKTIIEENDKILALTHPHEEAELRKCLNERCLEGID
ncbi:MAG: NAD-binding protein [Halanaerobiales bacterium]|nr:NAD-binding protein [Halanaerobiales bacterium]